jgi:hypothetical protein
MEQTWLLLADAQATFSRRFVIQPLMAIFLGLRDGKRDADSGHPPYILSLLMHPPSRKSLLVHGLKNIALPLSIGVVLDGIVQLLVASHIELWRAVTVGSLLVALPYMLSRALGNRLFSRMAQRREERPA